MNALLADENFPQPAVSALRALGHDVLTAGEAGLSNKRIPDAIVCEYATRLGRAVITLNWDDFVQIHDSGCEHAGIVVCEADPDAPGLARRIDAAIACEPSLLGRLVEVMRT